MILCADWGTSSLRLRLVDPDTETILSEVAGDRGIAQTQAGAKGSRMFDFQQVLLDVIGRLDTPVKGLPLVLSGMASSNIGMLELPYAPLPFRTDGSSLLAHVIEADKAFPHRVVLISGVSGAREVMRGEETQLVGCTPSKGGRHFVFPGTHSKHIHVEGPLALHMTTYMTGEFFSLLSRQSLLAGSVAAGGSDWEPPFRSGVADSLQGNLLQTAFWTRTNRLLGGMSSEDNYHYLSGLVIGSELKELCGMKTPLTIVADQPRLDHYLAALETLGLSGEAQDAATATVRGQCRIYQRYA
jgi:2-dehydro-3-deoxygalactonokinase